MAILEWGFFKNKQGFSGWMLESKHRWGGDKKGVLIF